MTKKSSDHKKVTGKKGEEMAAAFLIAKGYHITGLNVQCGRSEIDVIAQKEYGPLVFVEVKTRNTDFFGKPEEFVSEKKQKAIVRGAQWYIEKNNHHGEIRFDVIAVVLKPNPEIEHFEDAFWLSE